MQITIDHKNIEVLNGETILEAARRYGIEIPSMCYAQNAEHKSSCMVCAVRNMANGQIIPSCTTLPVDGMQIESETEEIKQIRTLSFELLLSDHRADCEAPCSLVCPHGLDVEHMLYFYDHQKYKEACQVIKGAFPLPEIKCDQCKAPCEKACRRGNIDEPVSIRKIIKELVNQFNIAEINPIENRKIDKKMFQSRLGRFNDKERQHLKEHVNTDSRCLHCACAGKSDCKLRTYATQKSIKRPKYDVSSELPVMNKVLVTGKLWFEQAKCIRCGLCVYNSKNGFTFKDRGFVMQVYIPEENRMNVNEELATLCPTGALYLENNPASASTGNK
ncbi:2Fe-2S iron-sulfur cluster-binding protein [Plebeiibacterium sediminum]|uniref:2Fe-2S iron-sulfur cluster-binding protein n=1 Tax=Plebeiibacterium sediminum TaxID=2992112 RepID=A0AAE3M1A0_9BACT|nr:2Fe-2S iron-sulfur cluster-binding protein [Plebeiobacterium sediminum]MCW3785273.1 2Fe-2S iron-sulfur cluster-binding protein [Plebeiobacterium sediminum]